MRPLGAGAMGEVYLARDTRLQREVAIKVLPAELADDAEHLARFEREAKLLATISHTNIAGIFAVEKEGDTNFIVLELVPGMTLGERIAGGPLPVREVLKLARQIAEGLEAAHEAGVVHRDLKPDNIRVTPDDTVKLLDFGLAKAMPVAGSESGRSRTDSLNLTQTGMLLGTPYYMSPEQVRGRLVDRRTDIWAFGCVLYEALTGTRAFPGDTMAEVAAAVLERVPDWDALPTRLPRRARELLEACLTRDPKNRLRDIGDARRELEAALSGKQVVAAETRRSRLPWLITGLAVAGMVAVLFQHGDPPPAPETTETREVRFQVPIPEGTELGHIALAQDGSAMALALRDSDSGESFLAVRRVDEIGLKRLPNTKNAYYPFWSPDGSAVGFVSDDKLKVLTLSTNQVREICDCPNPFGAPAWSWKGHILFNESYDAPLLRVPASGGEPTPATRLDVENLERSHRRASFLPDGESFTFRVLYGAPAGGSDFSKPPQLCLLRPGGWWAMWWNIYQDPDRPDPFRDAVTPLIQQLRAEAPSFRGEPRAALPLGLTRALQADARVAELRAAGFRDIEHETIRWEACFDTAGIRALYGSFSVMRDVAPERAEAFLDRVAEIAETAFGGQIRRACVMPVYTARR